MKFAECPEGTSFRILGNPMAQDRTFTLKKRISPHGIAGAEAVEDNLGDEWIIGPNAEIEPIEKPL
jgi:hypothetical protein